jgi:hypothetical protein
MTIKKMPWCATCKFWSSDDEYKITGWCHQHQIVADSDHWCERHQPVIISKVMTSTPITEAVQVALYFAKYTESTISEYCWACDKIEHEITDVDRKQVYPPLAAAARILAAEVERLTKELQP